MNSGENVEKRRPSSCWWECKLIKPLGRTVWRFLKKLKIEPYDLAIPLLGRYPRKTITSKDTWSDVLSPFFAYVNFPCLRNQVIHSVHTCGGSWGWPSTKVGVAVQSCLPCWAPEAMSYALSHLSSCIARRHRGRTNSKLKHVNILQWGFPPARDKVSSYFLSNFSMQSTE